MNCKLTWGFSDTLVNQGEKSAGVHERLAPELVNRNIYFAEAIGFLANILFLLQTAGREASSRTNVPARCLLLPASAEYSVKLHETLVLGAARLRQRELSGKK